MFDNTTYKRRVSSMPQAFQSYKPRHMKVYGTIVINNFGEILLVHGRLSKKWSFPKGHCKDRETDLSCALRELHEETGLTLTVQHTSYHKLRGGSYFVFAISGRPLQSYQDHREVDRVQWFPIDEIATLDTNVDVSIFNTLMRNNTAGKPLQEYIDSSEIQIKENIILRNISFP